MKAMHLKTVVKQYKYVQESSERVAALDQRLLAQLAQLQGTIGLHTTVAQYSTMYTVH